MHLRPKGPDVTDSHDASGPVLRVISGDATPEEIAAILALVTARSSGIAAEHRADDSASVWSSPANSHRRARADYHAQRHGWRTSFWPR
jgi:hypothetical protein